MTSFYLSGVSKQSRHVLCITADGSLQNETLCTAKPIPESSKSCDQSSEESPLKVQGPEYDEVGSGDGSSSETGLHLKKHV